MGLISRVSSRTYRSKFLKSKTMSIHNKINSKPKPEILTEEDKAILLKEVKLDLRSILNSAKAGLTSYQLINDYLDITFQTSFPNEKFSCSHPDKFFQIHCQDIMKKNLTNKWIVISSSRMAHINKLVTGQRSDRRSGKSVSRMLDVSSQKKNQ